MDIIPVIDVHQNNGTLVTTSRNVAEVFGKLHKNVLADIEAALTSIENISKTETAYISQSSNLSSGLNKPFFRTNSLFIKSEYKPDPNGRSYPEYLITKDGLTLLVMGYTGETAMRFKLAYIQRFNEMEALLKEQQNKTKAIEYTLKDRLESTALILQVAGITGNQLALALDKQYRKEIGYSAIKATNTALVAPIQEQLATPTQLGKIVGIGPRKVNLLLEELGYQVKTSNGWEPTKLGLDVGGTLLDVNKAHSSGVPVRQLKWPFSLTTELQQALNEE